MFEKAFDPEKMGVSSRKLLEFIDRVERENIEIHSLILLRHGREVCRMNWKPYDISAPHMLFSLSKSFTSCAAGFAVAEGLLSYDTRVADVLSDKLPAQPSERLLRITLGDLLCMGSGLDPASDNAPEGDADWCAHVLGYEVTDEPGTHFNYNSLGTYLVSAMVTRVTGLSCRDYLKPRLFDRIGIRTPEWDASPQGISCGGWGLHLSCEDIARFGQLLLQRGMWQGERVLPEGWIETASAAHIDNSGRGAHVDWEQGYGYQFWRCREGRYRGDGMCGQYCIVCEPEDAVLAMTAGVMDMSAQMDAVHDCLLGALDAEPGTAEDRAQLAERIAALEYAYPADDGSGRDVSGLYRAGDGSEMRIACTGDAVEVALTDAKGHSLGNIRYPLGGTAVQRLTLGAPGAPAEDALCGGGWHDGTLELVMRLVHGPFVHRNVITFADGRLKDEYSGAGFGQGTAEYSPA